VGFSLAIALSCAACAGWWPVSVWRLRALGDRAKRPVSSGGAVSISANLSLPSAGRLRLVRRNFSRLRGTGLHPAACARHPPARGRRPPSRAVRGGGPPAVVGRGDDRAPSPTRAMDGSAPRRRTRITAMSREGVVPQPAAITTHPQLASAWSGSPASVPRRGI
jgi:hypothetical protein